MHLVICGRVENKSKRADVTNQLRVNPKLKEKDELGVDKELGRRNCQGGWQVEPVRELKKSLKEGLSEGGGQVELLAAVVNLVDRPESPYFMTCPVEPVISKVNKDSSEDPSPGRIPGQVYQSVMSVDPGIG